MRVGVLVEDMEMVSNNSDDTLRASQVKLPEIKKAWAIARVVSSLPALSR